MPQSSITAWLKPKVAVSNVQKDTSPDAGQVDSAKISRDEEEEVENDSLTTELTMSGRPEDQGSISGTAHLPEHTGHVNTQPTSKVALPPHLSLKHVTKENITHFRRLISVVLPVSYSDAFYNSVLTDDSTSKLTVLGYWSDTSSSSHGRLVSAISGKMITDPNDKRIAPPPNTDTTTSTVYISTLATLSPYRGHGIAEALLRRVLEMAVHEYSTRYATVHVWQESQEAKAWYLKRGFEEVRFEEGYYRRLKPGGAWFLKKTIQPSYLLGGR